MRGFEGSKCSMWAIMLVMVAFGFVWVGLLALNELSAYGVISRMHTSLLYASGGVLAFAGVLYALRAVGTFFLELWNDVEFEDVDMADAITTERFRKLPR